MTEDDKVQMVQTLISDVTVTTAMIQVYLALAADQILGYVYPFGGAPEEWPTQYDLTQVQLAVRKIARRGGEGETSHIENGVSRTYGSVDDSDLLKDLMPYAGVT